MYFKDKKEGPNREDSGFANEDGYQQFAKDKRRRRTVSVERVERKPREAGEHPEHHGQPFGEERPPRPASHQSGRPAKEPYGRAGQDDRQQRRSYNPNFDNDNRPLFEQKRRDDSPRPQYKKDGQYGREQRPSRDGDRRPYGAPKPQRPDERGDYRNAQGKPRQGRPSDDERRQGKPWTPRKEHSGDRRESTPRPYSKEAPRSYSKESPRRPGKPAWGKDNYPRFTSVSIDKPVRLNRFVAMSGICSRREADDLIAAGVIKVNGQPVTEMGYKVSPSDEVRFNEQVIHGEHKVYIVMNKPKGFVTSIEDPHADKTVIDLVKNSVNERVYPVGRLDKGSMGVLLITNDGDLTKRLTHPSHNKKKVYQVTLERPLTKADMEKVASGIDLDDGPITPDAIEYVGEGKKEIGIEIHSGRNRIVRRIFESLGYHVQKLDRVYFAGLTKQKLKRGAWRFLTPREVAMLKSGEYE